MRALVAFFFLTLTSLLLAADPPAIHGMLIFGRDAIYLSHLPMFHRPHDYQAILEAELTPADKQAFEADATAHANQYYTLVPERFVLPEMVQQLGSFTATIFRGHFERGSTPILEDIPVKLKAVVTFTKLNAATPQPAHSQYLVFGKKGETYAAHLIHGAPDFDQIWEVQAAPGVIEIEDHPGNQVINPRIEFVPALGNLKHIYLEYGDLAG